MVAAMLAKNPYTRALNIATLAGMGVVLLTIPFAGWQPAVLAGLVCHVWNKVKRIERNKAFSGNHEHKRDLKARALVEHYAQIAGIATPAFYHVSHNPTVNAWARSQAHAIAETAHLARRTDPMALGAVRAHEVGHLHYGHDLNFLEKCTHALRVQRAGILYAALLGNAVSGPALAFAAAAPYVVNIANRALIRRQEYAADRFAAHAMGSPVPMARALWQMQQGRIRPKPEKHNDDKHSLAARLSLARDFAFVAIPKGLSIFSRRKLVALATELALYEGPFTSTHPDLSQRRRALHAQPRNRERLAHVRNIVFGIPEEIRLRQEARQDHPPAQPAQP